MKTASFTSRMAATLLTFVLLLPGWTEVWGQTLVDPFGHSLAICEAGNIVGFGNNEDCQMGLGSTSPSTNTYPHDVPGISNVVAVSTGNAHSLALCADGSVWAWGKNSFGCVGQPTSTTHECDPTEVANIPGCAVAISAGEYFSLALLADGTIYSWGRNLNGQLGNTTTTDNHIPQEVDGITTAVAISAGRAHAMALLADGTVKVWGYGYYGQMGDNTSGVGENVNSTPVTASGSGFSNIVQIAAGAEHCIALKSNNDIYVWGYNFYGQLGRGTGNTTSSYIPIKSNGLSDGSSIDVIDISAGNDFTVILRSNASTRVCGNNGSKQLGKCTGSTYPNPVNGPTISDFGNAISLWTPSIGQHTLVVNTDGDLYGWGNNGYDQLGTGGSSSVCTPVLINDPIIAEEEWGDYCPAIPSSDNHPQPCCVAIEDDDRTVIGENEFSTVNFTTTQNFNTLNMAMFGTITFSSTIGINYITNCDVVMGKNAKIIVNANTTLIIETNSHLYACGDMWDGILVNNGGKIYFRTSSIIEDAEVAMDIKYGAFYLMNNCTFNRNYIHVRKTMPTSGTPTHVGDYRIVKCKFRCHTTPTGGSYANLLPPRTSYITLSAIQAIGVPKILVGNTFANKNTFDNSTFGVSAAGVKRVEVIYNTFTDVAIFGTSVVDCPTNEGETILITDNIYNRSRFPVYCYDNGTTVEAHITDNYMYFAGMGSPPPTGMRGITVEEISIPSSGNYNKYNISSNHIFNATTGVYLDNLRGTQVGTTASLYVYDNEITQTATSTDQGAGIRLENVVEAAIVGNEVSHPSNSVNWHDHGIRVSNGNSNTIFCNNLHDIGNGLWFDGYQTTQTEVATNTFYRNGSAFLLNWGDIGPQPISSSGYDPHDNQWTETGTWWDVVANRYTTNVLGTHTHTTQFRVRSSAPSVYYPDENAATGGGNLVTVSVMGGYWDNSCEVFNGPSFKTDGSEEIAEQPNYLSVTEPSEAYSEREASQQWIGRYGLYDRLSRDEELRSSAPELESFFAESASSNMGKLHDAIEGFQAARNGETEAASAISQVQPVNRVESTLKEVLELLYANATNLSDLNADEAAHLREVARRCPLDDGFGVYMARATLLKLDTFPRNYSNECELAMPFDKQGNKMGSSSESDSFKVYPNPSNGVITIEYNLEADAPVEVQIYDLSGRSVYDAALNEEGAKSELLLKGIPSGLYLLRVTVNGETKHSERISVVRP